MFSWMKEDVEDTQPDCNGEDIDFSDDSFIADKDPMPSISTVENNETHSDKKVAAQLSDIQNQLQVRIIRY